MTEQKIVVVDGRKFETVPCNTCVGCVAYKEEEGGLHGKLCLALPNCCDTGSGGVAFVEVKEEAPAVAATGFPVKPRMLVVHHGNGEQSKRVGELLAQGYKLLSYDFTRQEALLVLDDDVVHPQFSVKG
jgi:hypothetical protein